MCRSLVSSDMIAIELYIISKGIMDEILLLREAAASSVLVKNAVT